MNIYLLLTERCNLSCMHCIRKNAPLVDHSVSFDEIEKYVFPFLQNFENVNLILTGGEPTLSPDFRKIVSCSTSLFNHVSICSNGTNLNKLLDLSEIKDQIEIQISLDGDSTCHNLIRGQENFDLILENIKILYAKGFKIRVSTVINELNVDSAKTLAAILGNFPQITWSISPEQAFNENAETRALPCDVWNTFVDEILKLAKNRVMIRKLYDFKLFEKFENIYGKDSIGGNVVPNCGFGTSKMYIYPDLSILPCTCIDMKIGNLKIDSHETILGKFKTLKITIDSKSYCYDCRWKYICNGGCPGYSFYRIGKLNMGDNRCPIFKSRDSKL